MNLIDFLIEEGWLGTPKIIEAFRKIKRKDFVDQNNLRFSEINEALPIGFNQTISQPLVVAFMLEQLQPSPGEKILDIGSGSGWTSCLLGEIVGSFDKNGKRGKVIALEIIPELKEFGEKNVSKYGFAEKGVVNFFCADGSKGFKKEAPYDKILASASASEVPQEWKDQLKEGGRIVAPVENSIWTVVKGKKGEFKEDEFPGFAFVPLFKR